MSAQQRPPLPSPAHRNPSRCSDFQTARAIVESLTHDQAVMARQHAVPGQSPAVSRTQRKCRWCPSGAGFMTRAGTTLDEPPALPPVLQSRFAAGPAGSLPPCGTACRRTRQWSRRNHRSTASAGFRPRLSRPRRCPIGPAPRATGTRRHRRCTPQTATRSKQGYENLDIAGDATRRRTHDPRSLHARERAVHAVRDARPRSAP